MVDLVSWTSFELSIHTFLGNICSMVKGHEIKQNDISQASIYIRVVCAFCLY